MPVIILTQPHSVLNCLWCIVANCFEVNARQLPSDILSGCSFSFRVGGD